MIEETKKSIWKKEIKKSIWKNLSEFIAACFLLLIFWIGFMLSYISIILLSDINKSRNFSIILTREYYQSLWRDGFFIGAVLLLVIIGSSKLKKWMEKRRKK
jgi:hypothetical protein